MGARRAAPCKTGGNRGIKMTYRTMSAKARTASKVFAALTATIMLAAVSLSYAVAQPTPAPANPPPAPAKPRPAPARPTAQPAPAKPAAQPAQQQQAPAAQQQPPAQQQATTNGGEQPQLIFSPWVKLCNKDGDPKAKRICVTVKDGRVESGLLVVSVAIIEMDGEAMSPQMDLKDFAKAYDGPPTDPKVFEEQQKKLQDELQKRAVEALKRLENQPPHAAAPAAPATPPAR